MSVYVYFYAQEDKADFMRKSFSDEKIDMFCKSYRDNYQQCLQKNIHKMVEVSTPMQITKISELIIHIYELDLIRNKGTSKVDVVYYDFFRNYYMFIEDISEFSFSRDQLDLFQIILFPYYRYKILEDLIHVQNTVESFEKNNKNKNISPMILKSINGLKKNKVGIFKGIL